MGLQHPAFKEWWRCQACWASQRKQAGCITIADSHSAIQRGIQRWTKHMFPQDTQQKDNSDNQKKKEISQWQGFRVGCHCWTPSWEVFKLDWRRPRVAWSNLQSSAALSRTLDQLTWRGPSKFFHNCIILPMLNNTKDYEHLIIHTEDLEKHIKSYARLENMNLGRKDVSWNFGCPELEQPNS